MLTKNQLINVLSELKIGGVTNQQVTQYRVNVEFKRTGFSHFTYTIQVGANLSDLSKSKKDFVVRYLNNIISSASGLIKTKASRAVAEREDEKSAE